MSLPAPALTIVPDRATRGRIAIADIEAAHPLGRWAHQQQDESFSLCASGVTYRDQHRVRRLHADRQADASIARTEAILTELICDPNPLTRQKAREALAELRGYWIADAAEDAHAEAGDACVAAMHEIGRRLNRAFERVLAVIRGERP